MVDKESGDGAEQDEDGDYDVEEGFEESFLGFLVWWERGGVGGCWC